jgi:nucleotide-binding universal stress UspA family protein
MTSSAPMVVLVALDGSPAAATALPVGRSLARQLDAALRVLHIAPPAGGSTLPDLRVEDAELQVEFGEAAERILANAADPCVAAVVLTTHGRELESAGRLGHVAEAVIARTEQPVLLVRPETVTGWEQGSPPLRRLLLPLDGTPTTAFLLRPATQLCAQLGATMDVLYVASAVLPEPGSIGAPHYVDQPQYEWPQWADEILGRLVGYCAACPPDVSVRAYLAAGDAGREIVRFASEHHSDAIIVARRSHLEPGRAATLRAILRGAPCPILLVGSSGDEVERA